MRLGDKQVEITKKTGHCAGCSLFAPFHPRVPHFIQRPSLPYWLPQEAELQGLPPASCGVWSRGGISKRLEGGKREKLGYLYLPDKISPDNSKSSQAMVTQSLPDSSVLGDYQLSDTVSPGMPLHHFLLFLFVCFLHYLCSYFCDQVIKATITKFFLANPFDGAISFLP